MKTKTERINAILKQKFTNEIPTTPKKEYHETSFHNDINYIYEQIDAPGFAIYNRETKKITYLHQPIARQEDNTRIQLTPLDPQAVEKKLVKLPTEATEYGTTEELLEEIQQFIHDWLDISEEYEELVSYYVLMSWVYDRMNSVCYLRALGDTGSGKTRFLDTLGGLTYKPIFVTGAATAAPIFRLLEYWQGTLVMDEADFAKSDTHQDIMKILNSGFEAGKPVVRCDKENPKRVDTHRVYGPKILTSRYSFTDKALEARCLTEKMMETRRDLPVVLNKRFEHKQQELRNKLLMFRFRNYDIITEQEDVPLMENIEPRLRQATRSFSLLFYKQPEMWARFCNFMKKYQKELIEERANSWEGRVVNSLYVLLEKGESITPTILAEHTNVGANKKEELSARKVGHILRSLGLTIKLKRVGLDKEVKRIVETPEDTLQILFSRYVPEYIPPKNECKVSANNSNSCNAVTIVTQLRGRHDFPLQDENGRVSPKSRVPATIVTNVTNVTGYFQKVLAFLRENNGEVVAHSSTDIAKSCGIPPEKVSDVLDRLAHDGYLLRGPDQTWVLRE